MFMARRHRHEATRERRGLGSLLPLMAATVLALGACAAPPQSATGRPEIPRDWWQAPGTADARLDAPWWRPLGDPLLAALIEEALQRNTDATRAALRVRQARLILEQADRDRGPTYSASVNAGAQKPLQRGGPDAVVINGVSVPLPANDRLTTNAGASLVASWEPDLWGRLADAAAVARTGIALAESDRDTARWLVTTNVAEQVWRIAVVDAKVPAARAGVADAQADLDAMRLRLAEGKARAGEVTLAEVSLVEARQREATLQAQRRTALLALAPLLDRPAGEIEARWRDAVFRLPEAEPTSLGAGVPAAVLDRRPDVRGKRLALDAALLKARIAENRRYPAVQLSAALSSGGTPLSQWLANPVASLGAMLVLPMVQDARLRNERDQALLQAQDAELAFRDSVVRSLAEVESQFSQRRQLDTDWEAARQRLARDRTALEVARVRHAAGADGLDKVRAAARTLRETESALIDLAFSRWMNLMTLHKALGGPV